MRKSRNSTKLPKPNSSTQKRREEELCRLLWPATARRRGPGLSCGFHSVQDGLGLGLVRSTLPERQVHPQADDIDDGVAEGEENGVAIVNPVDPKVQRLKREQRHALVAVRPGEQLLFPAVGCRSFLMPGILSPFRASDQAKMPTPPPAINDPVFVGVTIMRPFLFEVSHVEMASLGRIVVARLVCRRHVHRSTPLSRHE